MGFGWFEAPLLDTDIEGYRLLRRSSTVPIIAAGNTWLDLQMIEQAIKLEAWSAVRVDATICGGITPIRKVMALAEAHGMNVEVQCWGYTLTRPTCMSCSASATHLFQQPAPYPPSSMAPSTYPQRRAVHRQAGAGRARGSGGGEEGDDFGLRCGRKLTPGIYA
jgi:L-alanine-DL-glutamate epimerase-like enolase superfamily enzyme